MPQHAREHSYRFAGVLPPSFRDDLMVRNVVEGSASSVLIRKACFDQLGGFDTDLTSSEDWDMWLRIAAQWKRCLYSL